MPSVTILIPCLQESHFIRECLQSVLAFEVPPETTISEILVLDGGSTDGTRELVSEIGQADPRVHSSTTPAEYRLPDSTSESARLAATTSCVSSTLGLSCGLPRRRHGNSAAHRGDNVGGLFNTQRRGTGYQAALVQALTTHKFGSATRAFEREQRKARPTTAPSDSSNASCSIKSGCSTNALFERLKGLRVAIGGP